MADYRYQIVEHNGIPCLHVLLDDVMVNADGFEEIMQTYIPLDDIMFSALSQGYVMSEELLHKLAEEHIRSKKE